MAMKFLEHFDHPERKQGKEHFIHLIQIANADGTLEHDEVQMLYRMGKKLGLTEEEIKDLMESTQKSSYIPPYELSKRFEQLYDVVRMIFADDHVDEREKEMASALALKSGFDEADVPLLIDLLISGIRDGSDEEDLFVQFRKRRMAR